MCGHVNDFDELIAKAERLEKMLKVVGGLKTQTVDAKQRGKLVGRLEHCLRDVEVSISKI